MPRPELQLSYALESPLLGSSETSFEGQAIGSLSSSQAGWAGQVGWVAHWVLVAL